MPALFPPRSTFVARAVLLAALGLVIAVPALAMIWVRTPWARGEHRAIAQPVPFDHRMHVNGARIDCRYCHSGADRTAMAGLPSTQTCVACHSRVMMATNVMTPVRRSMETGRPIEWARVTQLPSFVYFNHAMHTTNGVACESCHGRVDQMMTAEQVVPLTMSWCLDCHRDPAPRLRPVAAVTAMGWTPPPNDSAVLAATNADRVKRLTNCTTCHR